MTVSAVRPWRNALRRERSLPSGVVGPVLLSALRRLASIRLRDVIENRLEWVRFVIVGAQCRSAWPGALPSPLPICPPWWSSILGRGLCSVFIWLDVCRRRFWVCLLPKPLGNLQGVDFQILPPGHFIAGLMQLPMMTTAERYGELVADFETQRSELRKPQVMRIGGLPAADETRL